MSVTFFKYKLSAWLSEKILHAERILRNLLKNLQHAVVLPQIHDTHDTACKAFSSVCDRPVFSNLRAMNLCDTHMRKDNFQTNRLIPTSALLRYSHSAIVLTLIILYLNILLHNAHVYILDRN